MQIIFVYLFKGLRFVKSALLRPIDWLITYFVLYSNGVKFASFRTYGWPRMNVGLGGKCQIGTGFRMNNRVMSNPIGRFNKCCLIVSRKGELIIGKNVGMSSTAIVCHAKISIGDHVKFGGNVVVYDTDFHSLNPQVRMHHESDMLAAKVAPIKIGNNAFIGAHTTILKGVEIGDNSIIGACSVVTSNVPANEIWAGNPAKKIRSLRMTEKGFE